jgi:hypothetical protein
MPAVIPLIVAGVSAASAAAAAKTQANAIKSGAAIQGNSTQQAIDFTKQHYADVTGRLKPYVDAGSTASETASRLLQSSPYAAAIRPPAAPPMVTLRAPDGSTKQFATGDPLIAKAQAAGAQVVTGGAPPAPAQPAPARLYGAA